MSSFRKRPLDSPVVARTPSVASRRTTALSTAKARWQSMTLRKTSQNKTLNQSMFSVSPLEDEGRAEAELLYDQYLQAEFTRLRCELNRREQLQALQKESAQMWLNVQCLCDVVSEKKVLLCELETSFNYLRGKKKECEIVEKALVEVPMAEKNLRTLATTMENNAQRLRLKGAKMHRDSMKEVNHVLAKAAPAIADFSNRVNSMQNPDDVLKMRDLTEELKVELEVAVGRHHECDILAKRICELAIRESSLKASVN